MSVLKNLDINLSRSEKQTLARLLALYVIFSIAIVGLTASLYFSMQKEINQSQRKIALDAYTNDFLNALENLKKGSIESLPYTKSKKFKISLYDKNYRLIYSTLRNPPKLLTEVQYSESKNIRYITNPQNYYRNTQYVVVTLGDDAEWFHRTITNIMLYSLFFFVVMLIMGYFLLHLFLKPMRDALHLLDTFIKDTTHELNTPVSTILTNIELIDKASLEDKKLLKIINRIDIGAKTISNVYDDLTYLTLNNRVISENHPLQLKPLIEQRVEYFTLLATQKKITIEMDLDDSVILSVDSKKITKLIDNILSNAIKYNKMNGSIFITLTKEQLCIKDRGRGIEKKDIDSMFERYARFDTSVGGFGIGLSIVKMICDEYGFEIKIDSQVGEWTKVTLLL